MYSGIGATGSVVAARPAADNLHYQVGKSMVARSLEQCSRRPDGQAVAGVILGTPAESSPRDRRSAACRAHIDNLGDRMLI